MIERPGLKERAAAAWKEQKERDTWERLHGAKMYLSGLIATSLGINALCLAAAELTTRPDFQTGELPVFTLDGVGLTLAHSANGEDHLAAWVECPQCGTHFAHPSTIESLADLGHALDAPHDFCPTCDC